MLFLHTEHTMYGRRLIRLIDKLAKLLPVWPCRCHALCGLWEMAICLCPPLCLPTQWFHAGGWAAGLGHIWELVVCWWCPFLWLWFITLCNHSTVGVWATGDLCVAPGIIRTPRQTRWCQSGWRSGAFIIREEKNPLLVLFKWNYNLYSLKLLKSQ